MKERLVEDWLSRINERGYQAAFVQILAAKGFTILRSGHSPYEHGKDVLAIAPEGEEVRAYQLKDGDMGLKEWERGYPQVVALVETIPTHPSLPKEFKFRPFLVTNGIFTDPALSRIEQTNQQWEKRKLPKLEVLDGRWMHVELTKLAADFWPTAPPDVRSFRALYLVDGRGDFDAEAFAKFLIAQLPEGLPQLDLERRSAALNIFVSYALSEFYRHKDHWSIFRAWVMTAARLACVAERAGATTTTLKASFDLAFDAAVNSLSELANECADDDAFKPNGLEWDEYTRLRNTVALGAWATWCLIGKKKNEECDKCIQLLKLFIQEGRLSFWGESCFTTLCSFVWILECHGHFAEAQALLINWLEELTARQQRGSDDPLFDAYASAEDTLIDLVESSASVEPIRPKSVHSHSLFPLVLLLVNRNCRQELAAHWLAVSHIVITMFKPAEPAGYLDWTCANGSETDQAFSQPQSWVELVAIAAAPSVNLLPRALRENDSFKLAFLMAFPHRLAWSIIGSLDRSTRECEAEAP